MNRVKRELGIKNVRRLYDGIGHEMGARMREWVWAELRRILPGGRDYRPRRGKVRMRRSGNFKSIAGYISTLGRAYTKPRLP